MAVQSKFVSSQSRIEHRQKVKSKSKSSFSRENRSKADCEWSPFYFQKVYASSEYPITVLPTYRTKKTSSNTPFISHTVNNVQITFYRDSSKCGEFGRVRAGGEYNIGIIAPRWNWESITNNTLLKLWISASKIACEELALKFQVAYNLITHK